MDAEALLLKAGWSPERKADADDAARAWAAEGWEPPDAGRSLLSNASGLIVRARDGRELWFDGVRAVREWDPGWCRAYRAEAGRLLLPVGGYSHMMVLTDEGGGLWGGFDTEYGHVADSIAGLVQVLLLAPGSKYLALRLEADV
jgi:hypothetical protein